MLLNLSFLHGWFPTAINSVVPGGWSVGVEMMFYLLVPLIFSKFNSLARSGALLALSIYLLPKLNTSAINFYVAHLAPPSKYLASAITLMWLPTQLPTFMVGVLLFLVLYSDEYLAKKARKIIEMFRGPIGANFILALTVLSWSFVCLKWSIESRLLDVVLCLVVISLYLDSFLVNRFTCFVGKISYSLYLNQFIVLSYLMPRVVAMIVTGAPKGFAKLAILLPIAILINILISSATYYFLERPFIRFGNRLIQRFDKKLTMAASKPGIMAVAPTASYSS